MKRLLRQILRRLGYDMVSYPYFANKQRRELFKKFDINTIVDIGANEGQYATSMWDLGYTGAIISFEPVKVTFEKLRLNKNGNKRWVRKNMAIGLYDGQAVMNVSQNTLSSSLLAPLEGFLDLTPEAKIVRQETVEIRKLDTLFTELKEYKPGFFLKIDSQGYEKTILDGARDSLAHFSGIQIELSLKSLYEGENTFVELFPALLAMGFNLYEIERGYCNRNTGEVLQVELILFRTA